MENARIAAKAEPFVHQESASVNAQMRLQQFAMVDVWIPKNHSGTVVIVVKLVHQVYCAKKVHVFVQVDKPDVESLA